MGNEATASEVENERDFLLERQFSMEKLKMMIQQFCFTLDSQAMEHP